ncbi:MAG: hypothetical protein J0M15_12765 [Deltaproteobacteria bacterium]|nr:hypothetical protein [Deltaproteobacteria bacterium]
MFVYKKKNLPISYLLIYLIMGVFSLATKATKIDERAKPAKLDSKIMTAKELLENKKWTYVFQEADDVQKEIVWLLTGDRPLFNKTLYGKVLRAKNQYQKIKLKDKSRHQCDVYELKVFEKYFQVFEYCQKYRTPDLLAQVSVLGPLQIKTVFYGQNYADSIGLSASLVAPRIDCDLTITPLFFLKRMECSSFKVSRKDEVIELSQFVYDKDAKPTISLEGQVLKNLLPYSKLSVTVPVSGKITIKETKIRPDADEVDKTKPQATQTISPAIQANPHSVAPPSVDPSSSELPIKVNSEGEPISPREDEKKVKQSEPDMIELKEQDNQTPYTR